MNAKTGLTLALMLLAAGAGAVQAQTRVFTRVDANGNPIGPSVTIRIPDEPNATTRLVPVDRNGAQVGRPVNVPDHVRDRAPPPEPKSDDGMVEESPQ